MSRSKGVADFLASLLDLRPSGEADLQARPLTDLCDALLSTEGQVSGRKLATAILEKYRSLTADEKLAFFTFVNDSLDVDADQIAQLAASYAKDPSPKAYAALSRAAEPRRQELFRRLNQAEGATAHLVDLRVDLLRLVKSHPTLKRTDMDLVHLLRSWFNRGFLKLQQITWGTPANILEKIVAYEAVHEIQDWDDLRRRLAPPDRRCFAFFHPAMEDEPLIFVEVALTQEVPGSIQGVLAEDRAPLNMDEARTAVFYSISNCQRGLQGISFGNLLIKQVAQELAMDLPQLTTFVTLSPIPGLMKWADSQDLPEDVIVDAPMAAHYLTNAKRADGLPLDPVARFHLGNGAAVYAVHDAADTTDKGQAQSNGVMVNYLYDLSQTETNHEGFALNQTIAASKPIKTKAKQAQTALRNQSPESK